MREVLAVECSSGKNYGTEIESGALGATDYRKARFLHIFDNGGVVDWVRYFISEWYPAHIAKDDDTYVLQHAENITLRIASFEKWLMNQPGVPDSAKIDMHIFNSTELPDPNAESKVKACELREKGATLSDIATKFGVSVPTASDWCAGVVISEDVQKMSRRKSAQKARESKNQKKEMSSIMYASGKSFSEIAILVEVSTETVRRWINSKKF